MEKQNILGSTIFKITLPLLVVLLIIYIAQTGYYFGQWLRN